MRGLAAEDSPTKHPLTRPSPEGEGVLALPYDFYTDTDIAHRVIYVEASRGCPFKCEFCLSSLDVPVRNVPIADFLASMQRLLDRGVQNFKFVDRTFNLNLNISKSILQFFLERLRPGLFLHFEMIPDRLPEALRQRSNSFRRRCCNSKLACRRSTMKSQHASAAGRTMPSWPTI